MDAQLPIYFLEEKKELGWLKVKLNAQIPHRKENRKSWIKSFLGQAFWMEQLYLFGHPNIPFTLLLGKSITHVQVVKETSHLFEARLNVRR